MKKRTLGKYHALCHIPGPNKKNYRLLKHSLFDFKPTKCRTKSNFFIPRHLYDLFKTKWKLSCQTKASARITYRRSVVGVKRLKNQKIGASKKIQSTISIHLHEGKTRQQFVFNSMIKNAASLRQIFLKKKAISSKTSSYCETVYWLHVMTTGLTILLPSKDYIRMMKDKIRPNLMKVSCLGKTLQRQLRKKKTNTKTS